MRLSGLSGFCKFVENAELRCAAYHPVNSHIRESDEAVQKFTSTCVCSTFNWPSDESSAGSALVSGGDS